MKTINIQASKLIQVASANSAINFPKIRKIIVKSDTSSDTVTLVVNRDKYTIDNELVFHNTIPTFRQVVNKVVQTLKEKQSQSLFQ